MEVSAAVFDDDSVQEARGRLKCSVWDIAIVSLHLDLLVGVEMNKIQVTGTTVGIFMVLKSVLGKLLSCIHSEG